MRRLVLTVRLAGDYDGSGLRFFRGIGSAALRLQGTAVCLVELLANPLPAILSFYKGAAGGSQAPAKVFVFEEFHEPAGKILRRIRYQNVLAVGYAQTFAADRRADYRFAHGHGIQNFKPRSPAFENWTNANRRSSEPGPHILGVRNHHDAGVLLRPAQHVFRGIFPRQVKRTS